VINDDNFARYGSEASLNNRDWQSRKCRHNLRNLLIKLGIKSAVDKKEEVLAQMLANLQAQVYQNYGQPDQLIMSSQAMEGLMKQLGKPPKS
jgi:uncharacterized protein (DUF1919 family)